jgi:DNA adenine methylase
VRGGFYFFVRDRERTGRGAAATADFLFVREFFYGSMFRHNADGAFNIPYGGTSYNAKRFLDRVDRMRAPETRAALGRAAFSCGDFEPFLAGLALGAEDLVFADPPYDSDFKSYGPAAFGEADHRRLAKSLGALACPWLLVIKETELVRATYLSKAMQRAGARQVHAFGKKYGYNVRGRNERATRHVAIANYEPPRGAPLASARSAAR